MDVKSPDHPGELAINSGPAPMPMALDQVEARVDWYAAVRSN